MHSVSAFLQHARWPLPEHRLLVELLTSAPRDYADRRHRSETLCWLLHRGLEPFAFDWVCSMLGLDVRWMRSQTLEAFRRVRVDGEFRIGERRARLR